MGFNMDKRWILILIIFLVGVAALYFVVDTSNTVGKAVVAVNTYTITVPETYNIENSETYLATVINRATGEKITVEDVGKGNDVDDMYEQELTDIQSASNVTTINHTTEKYKNTTLKTIYYEKSNKINKISVFTKFGHTFTITSEKYKDIDTLNEKTHFILDSLKQDYKKSQD